MNPDSFSIRAAALSGLACVVSMLGCSQPPPPTPAAKASPVGVYRVVPQRLYITTELPGRTSASAVAEIRPQVGGIVLRRLFEEGAQVRVGQVLYQIEPAGFLASHAGAQAGVAKAEATLASARVAARRSAELVRIDAISRQQDDDSQAALALAQADLGVARAALEGARINLDRTRITTPITGRDDLSTVTAGALVVASQAAALTTVQQLDPMVVDVVQSSGELLSLRRELADGTLKRTAVDEAPIRLLLEDGSAYAHVGRLKFSGVTVNRGTGAVTLRALVPNPEGVLMPGMYVRARLETGVAEQALLVPQQGVTRSASGEASALVVGPGGKVELRELVVDRAVGDRWLVTAGLHPGDAVIVDGLQRAKVGNVVQPVDAAASVGLAASAAASKTPASAAAPPPVRR